MGDSLTQPACPRCAAAVEAGATACGACGQELELTSPAGAALKSRASAPRLPRSSSPRAAPANTRPAGFTALPPENTGPSTDTSPAYVPPLASPSPLLDALPMDGTQTRNDRLALDLPPPSTEQTSPSLDPVPAVVTATAPAAAPLVEETTPIGQALAEPPPAISNEATHLKLEPVSAPVDSNQTHLKLPEVSAPPPRPPWPLVLLGSLATGALVLAGVLALMPTATLEPQVIEIPTVVEVKTVAEQKPAPTDEPKAVASNHPAPSYGDPLERKDAFYPEHPSEVVKRGVTPSRKPPAKGLLRVISTVRGNLVSAPLSVDHQPVGMTPKELKLKPGTHLFEVLTDGSPVTVHYPVTPEKRGKSGEILDIDITQDGESTRNSSVRQLDAQADRPMHEPSQRGGK